MLIDDVAQRISLAIWNENFFPILENLKILGFLGVCCLPFWRGIQNLDGDSPLCSGSTVVLLIPCFKLQTPNTLGYGSNLRDLWAIEGDWDWETPTYIMCMARPCCSGVIFWGSSIRALVVAQSSGSKR